MEESLSCVGAAMDFSRARRQFLIPFTPSSQGYVDKRNAIRESRDSEEIEEFNPPPLTRSVTEKYPGTLALAFLFSHPVNQWDSGTFAPLDNSVNEVYAYHGTFVRYALSIAENASLLLSDTLAPTLRTEKDPLSPMTHAGSIFKI